MSRPRGCHIRSQQILCTAFNFLTSLAAHAPSFVGALGWQLVGAAYPDALAGGRRGTWLEATEEEGVQGSLVGLVASVAAVTIPWSLRCSEAVATKLPWQCRHYQFAGNTCTARVFLYFTKYHKK